MITLKIEVIRFLTLTGHVREHCDISRCCQDTNQQLLNKIPCQLHVAKAYVL